MSFKVKKFNVMHLGGKSFNLQYQIHELELCNVREERDFSVIISSNIKLNAKWTVV